MRMTRDPDDADHPDDADIPIKEEILDWEDGPIMETIEMDENDIKREATILGDHDQEPPSSFIVTTKHWIRYPRSRCIA